MTARDRPPPPAEQVSPVVLHAVALKQGAPSGFWLRMDASRCTGCGWCVAACPLDLLSLEQHLGRKAAVLSGAETCTACRLCEAKCLFGAIGVQRQTEALPQA